MAQEKERDKKKAEAMQEMRKAEEERERAEEERREEGKEKRGGRKVKVPYLKRSPSATLKSKVLTAPGDEGHGKHHCLSIRYRRINFHI